MSNGMCVWVCGAWVRRQVVRHRDGPDSWQGIIAAENRKPLAPNQPLFRLVLVVGVAVPVCVTRVSPFMCG